MKGNKNKFNIGDLVKAQKGLFHDDTIGGYGMIVKMGNGRAAPPKWKLTYQDMEWALIRWPDGTTTKILECTEGWAQTELIARA